MSVAPYPGGEGRSTSLRRLQSVENTRPKRQASILRLQPRKQQGSRRPGPWLLHNYRKKEKPRACAPWPFCRYLAGLASYPQPPAAVKITGAVLLHDRSPGRSPRSSLWCPSYPLSSFCRDRSASGASPLVACPTRCDS